jgi:nicotinamidase-related amidase
MHYDCILFQEQKIFDGFIVDSTNKSSPPENPMKTHLLIIDPQMDFCDPKGALFVPGADADMDRLAGVIRRLAPRVKDIHITLDSHHRTDIAHPIWWKDAQGQLPKPFTTITAQDVERGVWRPAIPSTTQRSLEYVKALEKGGKFALVIWPPHCLIGTPGHGVATPILEALEMYENRPGKIVNYVTKGSNVFTEHYSVFRAEVEDPMDPTTHLNTSLVDVLNGDADEILVAGEAQSHCVASSIRDLADAVGDDRFLAKMTLITDAMSNVPGFEKQGNDFVADMKRRGMKTITTKEL